MNSFKVSITAIFLIFAIIITINGQGANYIIEGEVCFKGKGTVHVFLLNEELFNKQGEGLQNIVKTLSSEELTKGKFFFSFKNVPNGEYGIKCFIDENENGKLDKGVFGPLEPWGMSWKDKKPFGPPKFSQMCFKLDKDMKITITVE